MIAQVGWAGLAAVALGAVLGAWLRLGLGLALNPLSPSLPLGTLAANVAGGLMIGVAVAWLGRHPELSPAIRLFFVTGFLGALTTFSTFSAESLDLLQRGQFAWALAHSGVHLLGALAAAAAGHRLAS
ncbi:MAG: fluoride efflux transporter CrcB [Burkholderiaceae bacterium]